MTILFFFMLAVFCVYVGFIWEKYGILPSISDSYYYLPDDDKYLFTMFCWFFALPAIVIGGTPLMFLAGSGIAFVGAAPAFKEDLIRTVHQVGATVGVSAAQLSIYLDYHMLYVNIIFISLALIFFFFNKYIGNRVWWIELSAFASIVYVLAVSIF